MDSFLLTALYLQVAGLGVVRVVLEMHGARQHQRQPGKKWKLYAFKEKLMINGYN